MEDLIKEIKEGEKCGNEYCINGVVCEYYGEKIYCSECESKN